MIYSSFKYDKVDIFIMSDLTIDKINNPFTNIGDISITDESTNDTIQVTKFNLTKYFKEIYVLCPMSNNCSYTYDSFLHHKLYRRDFIENTKNMIIYKTTSILAKNSVHFINLIRIEKDLISQCNHFNYELDDYIIVLPILNISFLNLHNYLDHFSEKNTINEVYNLQLLYKYFCDSNSNCKTNLQLESIIKTLDDSNYWKKPYSCKLNLTKVFNKRRFNLKNIKTFDNNDINKILEAFNKESVKENYLTKILNSRNYSDPSNIINKNYIDLFKIAILLKNKLQIYF